MPPHGSASVDSGNTDLGHHSTLHSLINQQITPMEEDVPQPSTVPQVEDMDASHVRNDSLVTVRLSEPVQLKIDTKFKTKEESPVDQPELRDEGLPSVKNIYVEEEEQVTDRLSRPPSTVIPEGDNMAAELESKFEPEEHSLAAELDTGNLSTLQSRRGSSVSNISTIKAEAHNLATELAAEDLYTIESRRASRMSNISMIRAEAEGRTLAAELEIQDSPTTNSPTTNSHSPNSPTAMSSTAISPTDSSMATSPNAESPTAESRRGSNDSQDGEVNWAELQKNEAEEPKDQGSDDSTALLLARLEQENNSIVTNPKSGLARTPSSMSTRPRGQSRPPSMQQLKNMVNQPPLPSLRYSLIPAPPPMTDLEFYAALVRDYPKTLRKLPTLVSKKIRGGVPPPLRGVVWQSMAGSRDQALEEQYERLSGETSPYEGIIGKDLNRSFPGVEMFRDPDGDGQRMLGKVLKCFSLYDQKIGYCQGLGFLVGPLLMHMPDKEAFCILVKLMEQYDLRSCFLPDLSGLHVRIYQFRSLLKQYIPNVSAHLEVLQIEPAYVSQWFLSFFAVTCPLPMLFRIFDVIFAEGASETLMRVALSLMRKNEAKILACTELEDVMQLLLSRGIWDCYHSNANELVNDFVTFSGLVTHETLRTLAVAYKDSRAEVRTSDIGSVATRFLGRLWTGSTASMKSTPSLSPGLTASNRPKSFLRRSTSKQSIASTLNSIEGGSDSMISSATEATTISRDSANTDDSSVRSQSIVSGKKGRKTAMSTMSKKDSDLHGQIEDLLTAMNEMQRENAELETRLQQEKEEREEDKVVVRALLCGLTRKARMEALQKVEGDNLGDKNGVKANTDVKDFGAMEVSKELGPPEGVDPSSYITAEELSSLLDVVEERFQTEKENRRTSVLQSKLQLRDEVARAKEQLENETSKAQDLARRLATEVQEVANLREQVRDSHAHIRNAHGEKQRMERQINEMRQAARNRDKSPATSPDGSDVDGGWSGRSSTYSGGTGASGLRELKLGRSNSGKSTKTTFSKRTSSLINPIAQAAADRKEREHENTSSVSSLNSTAPSSQPPSNIADNETLILELVQAKTAKVMAEQEVEEMKMELESLRKMLKNGNGADHMEKTTSQGSFMSYMTRTTSTGSTDIKASVSNATPAPTPTIVATPPSKEPTPEPKPAAATPAAGLGFWGGWGKKS